ncbi:MAG: carbohydrate binding domain-containing protein, partial [Spirochaetales bacterium]|nr:carbohydrate binding domain-containing protein [Spirochaetales bacterium]
MKRKILSLLSTIFIILVLSCSSAKTSFIPFPEEENLSTMWMTQGVNLIKNNDFTNDAKGWGFFFNGGNANYSYNNKSAKILIKSTGIVDHGVQFYYDGFRLYSGGDYTFSFKASSTAPKGCEIRLQLNGGDYHAYARDIVTLDTEEKIFTINFVMDEDSDIT